MPKYVTRAIWCDELETEVLDPPQMVVYEDDSPQPTGLLDASGNHLYRVTERQPIGFKARD